MDLEKIFTRHNRFKNLLARGGPKDALPDIEREFIQVFEQLFKPTSEELKKHLDVYPLVLDNSTYETTDNLMSAFNSYRIGSSLKSDLRTIGNAFAHEDYRKICGYCFELNESIKVRTSFEVMMGLVGLTMIKTTVFKLLLPAFNLCILIKVLQSSD